MIEDKINLILEANYYLIQKLLFGKADKYEKMSELLVKMERHIDFAERSDTTQGKEDR